MVIRNNSGQLITNQTVGMQISILQGSPTGEAVYSEVFTPTTNANGLVSIEIGAQTGFDAIDWSAGPYFIKSETDPTGGSNYIISGTSIILSVPYAFHARKADTITGTVNEEDPVFAASPAADIQAGNLNTWNTAFGWGDHAAENYLKTESDPAVTSIFDLTDSETGDLLIFNGTKWVKFTPAYLTEFIENDPSWTGTADHTGNIGRTGYVGIGTTNPGAQLEVTGLMMLTPLEMPASCVENSEGSMYYDMILKTLCICNGTHWIKPNGSGYCECVDRDDDGFDPCDPSHPYDTDGLPADCDDNDPAFHPDAEELCDGKDNNCNGQVDENRPELGQPCTVGTGACMRGGFYVCNPDDPSRPAVCNAIPGEPKDEVCDNIDNDCNGQVDENWPELGQPCTVGTGACMRGGFYVCNPDDPSGPAVCNAIPGEPKAEVCDNIDNDCDGIIDNGFSDEYGIYYNDLTCGNCYTNCLAIYDLPNAYGVCNTSGTAPFCEMKCNDGYYDLDQIPQNGCEFHLPEDVVFVSPYGEDTGECGTLFNPCRSITYGINRALTLGKKRLFVANGIYNETVHLEEGIDLLGGYDAVTWNRNPSNSGTIISGTETLNNHPVTVVAENINQAEVSGFIIYGKNATVQGHNSYAVYINNSGSDLLFTDNIIHGGTAAHGEAGDDGVNGQHGTSGNNGTDAYNPYEYYDDATCIELPGGYGGNLNLGYSDISGGDGGASICPVINGSSAGNGESGYTAGSLPGGTGGHGGYHAWVQVFTCQGYEVGGPYLSGQNGENGVNGMNGLSGSGGIETSGTITESHWQGEEGSDGLKGNDGSGGGGGGAAGSFLMHSSCYAIYSTTIVYAPTGGGGGSGGQGGNGGQGGKPGGASTGIFIVNGNAPAITNNQFYLGSGGNGGYGGNGGIYGNGGFGGNGGGVSTELLENIDPLVPAPAGVGGNGGRGGNGGGGGGGTGGSSYGIYSVNIIGTMEYVNENSFSGGNAGQGGKGGLSLGQPGGNGENGEVMYYRNK